MITALFLMENRDSIIKKIKTINDQLQTKGGDYLLYLLQNPNVKFPFFYLEYIHSKECKKLMGKGEIPRYDMDYIEHITDYFSKSPILMIDEQTKREVQKQLKETLNKIEIATKIGNQTELYDLNELKSSLLKYLAEVLTQNGRIKYFHETIDKPKKAVEQNLRRFLKIVEDKDPELAVAIRQLLVISKYTISVGNSESEEYREEIMYSPVRYG